MRSATSASVPPGTSRRRRAVWVVLLVAGVVATACRHSAADDAAVDAKAASALATSKYVYLSSLRKDGVFGAPAEIWFMWKDGAVWVASPTTTWRVRRIRAGRARARIAIGSKDGPTIEALGAIVTDRTRYDELYRTFAAKYSDGWTRWEQSFRTGLEDGSRVLIRYQLVAASSS